MFPMALDPAQSAVSSSSTLWAQASKEWVIPAKPKPGRKPKKDIAPPRESQEVDSKGRRVQNRAAQRAFRERKQSQLADLQARVQSFEQGEIERNVALQQISKRLKEENEQLKNENAALKDEIARLKERTEASTAVDVTAANTHGEKEDELRNLKRWRDESVCSSVPSTEANIILESASRKRFRADTNSPVPSTTPIPQYSQNVSFMPSPPSLASSPDSNGISGGAFSPLPFAPLPAPSASVRGSSAYPTSAMFPPPQPSSHDVHKSFDPIGSAPSFDNFDCGLCTVTTRCLCREMAMRSATMSDLGGSMQDYVQDYPVTQASGPATLKIEDIEVQDVRPSPGIIEIPPAQEDLHSPKASILENLPAYQPAVPLRRNSTLASQPSNNVLFQIRLPSPEPAPAPSSPRSVALPKADARRTATKTIWQVSSADTPTCSGDPSNCPACKDDDFGKAFCRALGDSAESVSPPCASCPNPEACGKAPRSACASGSGPPTGPSSGSDDPKMIKLTPANAEHHTSASSSSANSPRPSVTLPSLSSATSASLLSSAAVPFSLSSASSGNSANSLETIPVNEAWARLKSHPNIAFADLSMLADVVARRTKCSGPVSVIHPAPGSITPERDAARSPALPEPELLAPADRQVTDRKDEAPIILTDPHAHFRAQEQHRASFPPTPPFAPAPALPLVPAGPSTSRGTISSALSLGPNAPGRPELVPQEELQECGRRRIREVDAAGVRDALRILDAQFGKQR